MVAINMNKQMRSLEDAAEVASDYWLGFDGAVLVAGVALVALGVVLVLVAGVFRAFLGVQIRELVLEALDAVEQHLVNLLFFLQLPILLVDEVLQLLQPVLQRLIGPALLAEGVSRLLVLLFVCLGVVQRVRLGTLDVGPAFGAAVRVTVIVHLLIIITFKMKIRSRQEGGGQRWLKVGWSDRKDSLRDSMEFSSEIEGSAWSSVMSVMSWFSLSLREQMSFLSLRLRSWLSSRNLVRYSRCSASVSRSSWAIFSVSELMMMAASAIWELACCSFWYSLCRWWAERKRLLSRQELISWRSAYLMMLSSRRSTVRVLVSFSSWQIVFAVLSPSRLPVRSSFSMVLLLRMLRKMLQPSASLISQCRSFTSFSELPCTMCATQSAIFSLRMRLELRLSTSNARLCLMPWARLRKPACVRLQSAIESTRRVGDCSRNSWKEINSPSSLMWSMMSSCRLLKQENLRKSLKCAAGMGLLGSARTRRSLGSMGQEKGSAMALRARVRERREGEMPLTPELSLRSRCLSAVFLQFSMMAQSGRMSMLASSSVCSVRLLCMSSISAPYFVSWLRFFSSGEDRLSFSIGADCNLLNSCSKRSLPRRQLPSESQRSVRSVCK